MVGVIRHKGTLTEWHSILKGRDVTITLRKAQAGQYAYEEKPLLQ